MKCAMKYFDGSLPLPNHLPVLKLFQILICFGRVRLPQARKANTLFKGIFDEDGFLSPGCNFVGSVELQLEWDREEARRRIQRDGLSSRELISLLL